MIFFYAEAPTEFNVGGKRMVNSICTARFSPAARSVVYWSPLNRCPIRDFEALSVNCPWFFSPAQFANQGFEPLHRGAKPKDSK
jgi:hypothetical protein